MELAAQDISFGYKGAEYPLFYKLNLKIDTPGFYSLFGFSGCGKSTLAKIIAGSLHPTHGKIATQDINTILLCYNTERLPGWLSIGRHLESVLPKDSFLKDELDNFINTFGLKHLLNKKFFRLSMGQKNRVNLVRYLLQEFDVLICDEALANVDEPSRNWILSVIKDRFCSEKIILYISHNIEEVCFFSKKIFILPSGGNPIGRLIEIEGMDGIKKNGHQDVEGHLQSLILEVLKAASSNQM